VAELENLNLLNFLDSPLPSPTFMFRKFNKEGPFGRG
jgi:hypothetical protein